MILNGIAWEQYSALVDAVGEAPTLRITYLDASLEIMTTSPSREMDKKFIARLVEAYADDREVALIGCGSATWRKKAKSAGLEADECYFDRTIKPVPDLAIEVVKTSGGVDKLAVYRRLAIPEVWFWAKGAFHVFVLGPKGYTASAQSRLLPGFDLTKVAALLRATKPQERPAAVRRFRLSLRRG